MESIRYIEDKFEDMNDREIARELSMPEDQVEMERRSNGFLRLEEFADTEEKPDSIELDFELDEMRKRQLQGFLGEKVCSLMENRIKELVSDHIRQDWVLKNKAEIISESRLGYSIGAYSGRKGDIQVEGSMVKHFDASEDEIREKIRKKCLKTDEELFKAFHSVRNPWIDFNFYAFRISGEKMQKFDVKDFSETSLASGKTMEVQIPVVDDFKVIALEVKTTEEDEEKLLSKNQRKVREVANESPFIDFFTLKIDTSFSDLNIPETFSGRFRKHS